MNDDDVLQTRLGDLLADPRAWEAPNPAGADALLAAIAAERGTRPAEGAEPEPGPRHLAPVPPPAPAPGEPTSFGDRYLAGDQRAVRRVGRTLRVLAAAAALVVIAGLVAVAVSLGGGDDGGDGGEGREVALAGSELAPEASATALVQELGSGVAIELDVSGLPPAAPGTYYQAWLKNADGDLITIGTFHMRGGDEMVELWAGVDLADYPTLTVTLQQEGAGQESSGQVVLSGNLAP